uniref:Uncharacterized protein n=1 Tax=Meloidogyne hapla TaxID=6305 RepID=A0A1I8B302_MELHA
MLSATFTVDNYRSRSLSHNSIIGKNNQQNCLNKENNLFRHSNECFFEKQFLSSSKNKNINSSFSSSLSSHSVQERSMSKSWPKNDWVRTELKDNFINKEQLLLALIKQQRAKSRLVDSYKLLQNAIKQMKEEYIKSKKQNLIGRYLNMQRMIFNLIQVERQYWQMYDIPTQAISETPFDYVIRISELLAEKNIKSNSTMFTKPGGTITQLLGASISIAERTKDASICNLLRAKSVKDLNEMCAQLSIEIYKIINKYLGIRLAIRELSRAYKHTRYYPLIPRYNLVIN